MRYNEVGINVDTIDKLILDIYTYAEKVSKTLNQICDVVEQTKTFYQCDDADVYRNRFNLFKSNFNVVNINLKSYADDMIKLKNKYQNIDAHLTNTVKNSIKNEEYKNYTETNSNIGNN